MASLSLEMRNTGNASLPWDGHVSCSPDPCGTVFDLDQAFFQRQRCPDAACVFENLLYYLE